MNTRPAFEREELIFREVERRYRSELHIPGDSASNFIGDTEDMLNNPLHLSDRDKALLNHCLKASIRRLEERSVVMLSDRQWKVWRSVMKRYTRSKRARWPFPWKTSNKPTMTGERSV